MCTCTWPTCSTGSLCKWHVVDLERNKQLSGIKGRKQEANQAGSTRKEAELQTGREVEE